MLVQVLAIGHCRHQKRLGEMEQRTVPSKINTKKAMERTAMKQLVQSKANNAEIAASGHVNDGLRIHAVGHIDGLRIQKHKHTRLGP